ncbi:MAG TPA: hypothetical protein VHE61_07020 [Opitutaceae bacterium]|nr:hypothetical protein [Opitutaceae bacterium]
MRIDGRLFWSARVALYPVAPEDRFVGYKPIGGTTCQERFSGVIQSSGRAPRR